MAKKLEYYVEVARDMIQADKDLVNMYEGMDRMVHLDYELPEGLRELQWMRNVRVTAPYDAYKASRKILSGMDERISIAPYSETEEDRRKANEIEAVMRWNFLRAASRSVSFLEDRVGSSVLYDMIAAQVIHIPTQIKALGKIGAPTRRQQAALRLGNYAFVLHNAKHVHVEVSHYMLERVVSSLKMTASEMLNTFGRAAIPDIARLVDENTDELQTAYVVYDYSSLDDRCVYYARGENEQVLEDGDVHAIIAPEDNEYPFLNWVVVTGGSAIDDENMYRRQPLLFPVWKAEQWVTANILASSTTSQVIAEFARPKQKAMGPAANQVRAEYGTPGGLWRIQDLNTDVVDMRQFTEDPALRAMWDRFVSDMQDATLPRILVNAEPQPNEPLGGFNLRLQTALGQLLPYKRLVQRFDEGLVTNMALWAHYTDTPIEGYELDYRGRPRGSRINVTPSDIKPDFFFPRVELAEDVPIDRVARVTAAINMSERLKTPVARVLEELGDTNPERTMREYARELIKFEVLKGKLVEIQDAVSGRLHQRAAAMAQQMIQQKNAGGAGGGGAGAPGAEPNVLSQLPRGGETAGNGPGLEAIPGVSGQSFNPAGNGVSPAEASPTLATQAGQTGQIGGIDIASILGSIMGGGG